MRVIRVGPSTPSARVRVRRASLWLALMGVPAACAGLVLAIPPASRPLAGVALAVGLTASVWLLVGQLRELGAGKRDLERLLAPLFGDDYLLLLGVPVPELREPATLLIGPAGVRAILASRLEGSFRLRGRSWEVRTDDAWVAFGRGPTLAAAQLRDAVERWLAGIWEERVLAIGATVVFPRRAARVVLEEPEVEVVTCDNAPWWAQRIGRTQRLDALRAGRLVEAVLSASSREVSGERRAPGAVQAARRA